MNTRTINEIPIQTINLLLAFDYLKQVIEARLELHFSEEEDSQNIIALPEFEILDKDSLISKFILQNNVNFEELIILLLTLIPHFQSDFLDELWKEKVPKSGSYPLLGGYRGKEFRGFLPTGETALFILAGDDLEKRLEVEQLFSSDHWFFQEQVLWLAPVTEGEPSMSGRIILNPELVEYFKTGKVSKPELGVNFPAKLITTKLEWEDLVLPADTMKQIEELKRWVYYHKKLMEEWEMAGKLNPGYRALFYGPPGTGKTFTASLLGKYTQRDVFRIDLSLVVSKYIGETEKNLSRLFSKAEHKDWILFFDEADALFGRRTQIRDSHDRFANQEVSFLLQRIESFDGLVILASNKLENMDEAFIRRFESMVHFPRPKAAERLRIWQQGFPHKAQLAPEINLSKIAGQYELSGGNIINAIRYASLCALAKDEVIELSDLLEGIHKEYRKEGRLV
jgi:hypothetical protein